MCLFLCLLLAAPAHAKDFDVRNNGTNTSYLFVSGTTGNVGIGSISPATSLDIAGKMKVSSDATIGGNITVSGPATVGGLMTVSGGMTVSSGTTVGSFQFTSGTTVVSAITTTIGAGSTDAQIPTAAAVFALSAGSTIVHDSGSNYSSMYATATGPTDGALSFAINGSRTVVIDHNGNVGIGTTGPAFPLEIHKIFPFSLVDEVPAIGFSTDNGTISWKTAQISSYVAAGVANDSDGYPGGLMFKTKNIDLDGASLPTAKMVIDSAGFVGIGTTAPVGLLDVNRKMIVLGNGNIGIGSVSPAVTLDVAGQMQVSGSTTVGGLMTVSGGMTISSGTTVGSFQFTSGTTVVSAITTTIGAGSTDAQIPTAKAVQAAVSAFNSTMIVQGDSSVAIADDTTMPVTFTINGVNSIVVNNQGNVGIGTTAPAEKLDVNGTVKADTVASSQYNDANGVLRLSVTSTRVEIDLK